MNAEKCIFCDSIVKHDESGKSTNINWCTCSNCGNYGYDDRFLLKDLQTDNKGFKLACLLKEMRLKHKGRDETVLFVDDELPEDHEIRSKAHRVCTLEELLTTYPDTIELIDRGLANLAEKFEHSAEFKNFTYTELQWLLFCPAPNLAMNQVGHIADQGYVAKTGSCGDSVTIGITHEGWRRLHQLREVNEKSNEGFVAMWFDKTTEDVWKKGIKVGIDKAGYKPVLISKVEHNNDICDEIIAAIRRSRFVVADFTAGCSCDQCESCDSDTDCEEKIRPRGGVYFEAGFAKGLGIPVIFVVREDQLRHTHFDTEHYNHIVYKAPEDLSKKLQARIEATIVPVV